MIAVFCRMSCEQSLKSLLKCPNQSLATMKRDNCNNYTSHGLQKGRPVSFFIFSLASVPMALSVTLQVAKSDCWPTPKNPLFFVGLILYQLSFLSWFSSQRICMNAHKKGDGIVGLEAWTCGAHQFTPRDTRKDSCLKTSLFPAVLISLDTRWCLSLQTCVPYP